MMRPSRIALHDGRESVVEQDHRGCLARHVGSAHAHGDADIGLPQRRRIVDAVAGHGDDFAGGLVGAHQLEFLGGAHPREDADLEQLAGLAFDEPARPCAGLRRRWRRCVPVRRREPMLRAVTA